MQKLPRTIILFAAACLLLSACGIKPGNLPHEDGTKHIPQTYPDITTDPAEQ